MIIYRARLAAPLLEEKYCNKKKKRKRIKEIDFIKREMVL